MEDILDCSQTPFITFDENMSVIDMNISARRLFFDKIGTLTASRTHNIFYINNRYSSRQLVLEALEKQRNSRHLEVNLLDNSKNERFYDVHANICEFDNNKYYSVIFHDITYRKKKEEKLLLEISTANKNNEAKSTFLAVMSHEMRTPLIGILGTHEILQDTNLTEEQTKYLEIATASSTALLNLINGILDFSKIEAGKFELEMIDYCPEDIINQVIEILAMTAFKKGLSLQSFIDPDIPTRIVSDPVRLHQILMNLVNNAIKFTEKGGISITVTKSAINPEELVYEVSDTGIGIPANKLDCIFDDFTQVESSTQRRYGGTGLGLAISNRLVELLGGRLQVSSEIGKGSTFRFSIQHSKTVTPTTFQIPSEFEGIKLLLVDNSMTSALTLKRQIQSFHIAVTQANTLNEAFDLLISKQDKTDFYRIVIVNLLNLEGDLNEFCVKLEKFTASNNCCFILVGHPNSIRETKSYHESVFTSAIPLPIRRTTLLQRIKLLLEKGVDDYKPGTQPAKSTIQNHTDTHILIADDSATNRIVTESMLNRAGYSTFTATNGKEAVSILQKNKVDLVLMDMSMPVMDGIEATIYIRTLPGFKTLPIIALTATALQEEIDACLHSGMNDYLGKPFTKKSLLDKLTEWTTKEDTTLQSNNIPTDENNAMPENTTTQPLSDDSAYIDTSVLSQMSTDLPSEMLLELINLFIAESLKRLEQIEKLMASKDITEVGNQSHALKGSAATFGAVLLTPLAEGLEHCCKQGNTEEIDTLVKQVIEVGRKTMDAYRNQFLSSNSITFN